MSRTANGCACREKDEEMTQEKKERERMRRWKEREERGREGKRERGYDSKVFPLKPCNPLK